jgi:site-specific recombinase XerD
MNTLAEAIQDYVSMRQNLGFKFVQVEHLLKDFAAFMDAHGAPRVTTELAMQWATQPVGAQSATWAKRLSAVRGFARYRSAMDAHTEIPERALLPNRSRRAKPPLYTEGEIANLLAVARSLKSEKGLRGHTYHCLFGLLVVTGLRISEALGLQRRDVNLRQGLLTIRGAKFSKSRLIPVHHSTRCVLEQYAKHRDAEFEHPAAANFLLRDRALLMMAIQTGLRLSEMTALRRSDIELGRGPHVRCLGKGRKDRSTPLTAQMVNVLKVWLKEPVRGDLDLLFPNIHGGRMSADAVQYLVGKHTAAARLQCPTLKDKHVSPHLMRHTAAMELLQSGVESNSNRC